MKYIHNVFVIVLMVSCTNNDIKTNSDLSSTSSKSEECTNLEIFDKFKSSVSNEVLYKFPIDSSNIVEVIVQRAIFVEAMEYLDYCGLLLLYHYEDLDYEKTVERLSSIKIDQYNYIDLNLDTTDSPIIAPSNNNNNLPLPSSKMLIDLDTTIELSNSVFYVFNTGTGNYANNDKLNTFSNGAVVFPLSKKAVYWILILR